MTAEYSEGELKKIIEQLEALEPKFSEKPMIGRRLGDREMAVFKQLVLDAISVLRSEFSPSNDHFTSHLSRHTVGSMGPDPAALHEVCSVILASINQLHRIRNRPPPSAVGAVQTKPPYVGYDRIAELRSSSTAKWDTRRLVRMLEELNDAHTRGAYLSVAMMLRAIKDHVPPIFGQSNFAAVAANHSPGTGDARSWKGLMGKLEADMKHIADTYLHQQIRTKELVPDEPGVDFKAALDLLLGETARLLR